MLLKKEGLVKEPGKPANTPLSVPAGGLKNQFRSVGVEWLVD